MNHRPQHHMSTDTPALLYSARTAKWAVLAALALSLFGCASINVSPQPTDTAKPAEVERDKLQSCLASKAVTTSKSMSTLESGEACWFVVQSELIYNSTGLTLKASEVYEITVPPGQFWYDKGRRVSAPLGDEGSWLTKHLSFIKRHREQPWFALMAIVKNTEEEPDSAAIPIKCKTMIFARTGNLYLYANDSRHFYGNNQGRIWIRIRNVPKEQSVAKESLPCAMDD